MCALPLTTTDPGLGHHAPEQALPRALPASGADRCRRVSSTTPPSRHFHQHSEHEARDPWCESRALRPRAGTSTATAGPARPAWTSLEYYALEQALPRGARRASPRRIPCLEHYALEQALPLAQAGPEGVQILRSRALRLRAGTSTHFRGRVANGHLLVSRALRPRAGPSTCDESHEGVRIGGLEHYALEQALPLARLMDRFPLQVVSSTTPSSRPFHLPVMPGLVAALERLEHYALEQALPHPSSTTALVVALKSRALRPRAGTSTGTA